MFWYMPAVIFCRRHRIFNNSLGFVQLFFQQSLILLNFFKELFSGRLLGGESQVIRFEFGNKFIIVIEFSLHISKIFGFFLILLSSNINFVSCNKKKCKSLIKYTLLMKINDIPRCLIASSNCEMSKAFSDKRPWQCLIFCFSLEHTPLMCFKVWVEFNSNEASLWRPSSTSIGMAFEQA